MNKQEFFDKLLELYKNTGRGLEDQFASMITNQSILNELILENKIVKIDSRIGVWYYPEGYYINDNALTLVDAYLGEIDEWVGTTAKELRKFPEYIAWKEENLELLEKSFGKEKELN